MLSYQQLCASKGNTVKVQASCDLVIKGVFLKAFTSLSHAPRWLVFSRRKQCKPLEVLVHSSALLDVCHIPSFKL